MNVCPLCDGYMSFRVLGEDAEAYCLCASLNWLDKRYEISSTFETKISPRSFDTLKPFGSTDSRKELEELLGVVKTWMKEPTHSMLIMGSTGVGKTHILQAIKTTLPWMTTYISAERMQSELFDSLKNNGTQDFIRALSRTPILLIDDWGIEHKSSFTIDALAAIINTRYNRADEYPTVITTNLRLSDLLGSSDVAIQRITSRMIDFQYSRFFRLTQKDFRDPVVQESRGK